MCGFENCFNGTIERFVSYNQFNLELGQEIHMILTAPIKFSMPPLTPKTTIFSNRQAYQSNFCQRIFYFVELEWFHECLDLFHNSPIKKVCFFRSWATCHHTTFQNIGIPNGHFNTIGLPFFSARKLPNHLYFIELTIVLKQGNKR